MYKLLGNTNKSTVSFRIDNWHRCKEHFVFWWCYGFPATMDDFCCSQLAWSLWRGYTVSPPASCHLPLSFPSSFCYIGLPNFLPWLSGKCSVRSNGLGTRGRRLAAYFMHEQDWQNQGSFSTASESAGEWGSLLQTRRSMGVRASFLFSSSRTRHPGDCSRLLGPVSCSFRFYRPPFLDFLLVKGPIYSNWLKLVLFSHLPNGPEVPLSDTDSALE